MIREILRDTTQCQVGGRLTSAVPDSFAGADSARPTLVPASNGTCRAKDEEFPHTVIEIDHKPKLTINRNKRGQIAASVDIYDERGYIIAQIENNRFTLNRNNYFKMTKTSNTLVVVDQRNQKVLDFRFLNAKTIRIDALLRFPELRGPIVLSRDGNNFDGHRWQDFCDTADRVDVSMPSSRDKFIQTAARSRENCTLSALH